MSTTTDFNNAGGKLLAYARRSHAMQGDDWEIEQRDTITAYAMAKFGHAPDLFVFEDTRKRVFDRPGLSTALGMASAGELGTLLIPSQSAIATMNRALAECLSRFARLDVAVHAIDRGRNLHAGDAIIGQEDPLLGLINELPDAAKVIGRRIVGYAKCDLGGSAISKQNQLLNAFSYCNHGRALDDFYCDAGGRLTWERPGFRALMQDVQAGRIGTIIVADFDRLGRTQLVETEFKQRCKLSGVHIESVAEAPLPGPVPRPRRALPSWRSARDRALHDNRFAWQRLASLRQRETRKR